MIDRKPVPIFWINNYNGGTLKNFDLLKSYLSDGYKVERVDKVDDRTIMYIVKNFFEEGTSDD